MSAILNQINDLLVYYYMELERTGAKDPKQVMATELSKAIAFSDKQIEYMKDASVRNMSLYIDDMLTIFRSLGIDKDDMQQARLVDDFLTGIKDRYLSYQIKVSSDKDDVSIHVAKDTYSRANNILKSMLATHPGKEPGDFQDELANQIFNNLNIDGSLVSIAASIAEMTIQTYKLMEGKKNDTEPNM